MGLAVTGARLPMLRRRLLRLRDGALASYRRLRRHASDFILATAWVVGLFEPTPCGADPFSGLFRQRR